MEGLKSLVIDNEVMPLLQEFQEFARHMDPNNGLQYCIVEHIQDVSFSYKFGPRWGCI
ncbi:hypothetical protein C1H46_016998 [Malus baccata]|uniref:Uncharacterized protein n=1 Tax=Malus baccata TaxID=106549 RepID=A0A540MG95_MALBA|nr:hypothetical protein C1H46_016998 [Malus baccata]